MTTRTRAGQPPTRRRPTRQRRRGRAPGRRTRRPPRPRPRRTGTATCGPWPRWTTCASARPRDVEPPAATRSSASPASCWRSATAWSSGSRRAPAADAARLVEGMEATLRLVNKAFEKSGIVGGRPAGPAVQPRIPRGHGHPADRGPARRHGAGGRAEGLPLNGRLLRPARVVIARAPEPRPADAAS